MPLQTAWDRAEIDLCGAFQNRWFSQSQPDLSKFLVKEMAASLTESARAKDWPVGVAVPVGAKGAN